MTFVRHYLSDMETISVHQFTRLFAENRRKRLFVTDRGRVIGSWIPVGTTPEPVDYARRIRECCAEPFPFTGAALIRESRKR